MAKRKKKAKATTKKAHKKKASKRRRKPAPTPGLLTRRQLAALLEKHPMTVTKWEQEGLPIAKRGSKGRPSLYREADVRAWLQIREEAANKPGAVNPVQERARKERAQAILAEQAFSIRMRDLLPRDEVEKAWTAEVTAVRAKLLTLPAALADQVCRVGTVEGVVGVERVLTEAIRDVLRELADPLRPGGGIAA